MEHFPVRCTAIPKPVANETGRGKEVTLVAHKPAKAGVLHAASVACNLAGPIEAKTTVNDEVPVPGRAL